MEGGYGVDSLTEVGFDGWRDGGLEQHRDDVEATLQCVKDRRHRPLGRSGEPWCICI